MSEREYEELAEQYASGQISRRKFIGRMVASGVGVAAAVAFASSSADAFGSFGRPRGHTYGHVYGRVYGRIYGVQRPLQGPHRPLQPTPRRPIQLPGFSSGNKLTGSPGHAAPPPKVSRTGLFGFGRRAR